MKGVLVLLRKNAYKLLILSTMVITLVLTNTIIGGAIATPKYNSFSELMANETEGVDYSIQLKDNSKDITIFTVHGGNVSIGTSDLVNNLVSGDKYNYYLFEGIKNEDNFSMHITSTKFDEPRALNLVQNSENTVSFIGIKDAGSKVYVGGMNKLLAKFISLHLQAGGYEVCDAPAVPSYIAGVMNSNIVNKNQMLFEKYRIGGVQISLPRELRDELLSNPQEMNQFTNCVDDALSISWPVAKNAIDQIAMAIG
jgi:phage replication-related protein YjqB (UPF0714/DUF867 family)